MALDLAVVVDSWFLILSGVIILMIVKFATIYGVARIAKAIIKRRLIVLFNGARW